MATYGWKNGSGRFTTYPVANTSAIAQGDIVMIEAATVGGVGSVQCVTKFTATNEPCGVAIEASDAPTAHGGNYIKVYNDPNDRFEYPPDTGTVDGTLVWKTMDLGGAQSIDIDGSTYDNVICTAVDSRKNTLEVRIKFDDSLGAV